MGVTLERLHWRCDAFRSRKSVQPLRGLKIVLTCCSFLCLPTRNYWHVHWAATLIGGSLRLTEERGKLKTSMWLVSFPQVLRLILVGCGILKT